MKWEQAGKIHRQLLSSTCQAVPTSSCHATPRLSVQTRGEVRVLRSLQHPNIVQYHDCWTEAGGTQYISMEFCEVPGCWGGWPWQSRL